MISAKTMVKELNNIVTGGDSNYSFLPGTLVRHTSNVVEIMKHIIAMRKKVGVFE